MGECGDRRNEVEVEKMFVSGWEEGEMLVRERENRVQTNSIESEEEQRCLFLVVKYKYHKISH